MRTRRFCFGSVLCAVLLGFIVFGGGCSSDTSSGGGEADASLTGVTISGKASIEATGETTLTANPSFSSAARDLLVTYTWEITKGEEYASIKSSTGTAVVTGKNTTTSAQSATVSVTATYNGVQKSATQTISIAAASSDNPDNPVTPDNPDTPDTPSTQTKITITYSTERGTAPDAKTVELTDSLYTLTSDDLPDLTEKGYSFGGWAVSASSTTPDTSSTTTVKAGDTITENTTLCAVWSPITYTVRFDANGGSGEAIQDISATYDVSFEIPANTFTRSGYSASSNNTWNKKEDGSGTSYSAGTKRKNLSSIDGKIVTLYAIWVEQGSHSIAYLDSDGNAIDGMSLLTFKETEDVVLSGVVPSKAGYTFEGWSETAVVEPAETTITITGWKAGEKTSDVTLYAVWIANTDTAYTVKHYLQNVALDGYEEQTSDAESKTGMTGKKTSAEAKTYAGFTAKSYEQETIAGDGSTVVSIYYDRKEITLTFDTDGGSEIAPITGKYGTVVTAPAEPTKEGVIFSYWNPSVPETFPEEDTTYTAQWVYPSDATPYKVRHMVRTLDGDDYELYEEETLFGKAGEQTQAAAKNIKGFTAYSFILQWTINSDGSTVVDVDYSRNYVNVKFATGISYYDYTSVWGYYGAELTPPDNPERSGYTFAGWSPEVPKTFPAENTTYTAQWDDGSRSYKVRHLKETLDGAYELCEEETLTGKAGEYTNAYSSSYDGFTAKSFDQEIIAEDESTVVSIYYDLDTFTLTFDTNGGSEIAPVSGKYGASVPEIENPSKAGYKFS